MARRDHARPVQATEPAGPFRFKFLVRPSDGEARRGNLCLYARDSFSGITAIRRFMGNRPSRGIQFLSYNRKSRGVTHTKGISPEKDLSSFELKCSYSFSGSNI